MFADVYVSFVLDVWEFAAVYSGGRVVDLLSTSLIVPRLITLYRVRLGRPAPRPQKNCRTRAADTSGPPRLSPALASVCPRLDAAASASVWFFRENPRMSPKNSARAPARLHADAIPRYHQQHPRLPS